MKQFVSSPWSFVGLGSTSWRRLFGWGGVTVLVLGLGFLSPVVSSRAAWRAVGARLDRLDLIAASLPAACDATDGGGLLSLRTQRLGGLLSSWETIGGCGAGGSGSATAVKWIGRNVHGGLFNVTQTMSYLYLYNEGQANKEFQGGYNLTSTTQIGKNFDENWGASLILPLVYRYYRDYVHNDAIPSYDISNGGLADPSVAILRKFGEIHDTIATLTVGVPIAGFNATDPGSMGPLTQEKQLGFAGPLSFGHLRRALHTSVNLNVDHVFDQVWGIVVAGGFAGWRGGENEVGSYRAPNFGGFGYVGYYAGPFVPAVGLTGTGFLGHDKERGGLEQKTPLATLTPVVSLEWATDYVAFLVGGALPFGTSFGGVYSKLPWTASLGISISPF